MKKIDNLKPLLQGVIALWRAGKDLKSLYPRPTFYRHRKAILAATGIDIFREPNDSNNYEMTETDLKVLASKKATQKKHEKSHHNT
jgi:hypothetical protein